MVSIEQSWMLQILVEASTLSSAVSVTMSRSPLKAQGQN